jgi:release factor glutamine methyltransferase
MTEAAVVGRLRAAGCVFAEDEARLLEAAAASRADLETLVARRVAGEPLEYIVGWAEFAGHRFAVAPGVFVPRHRTEFLVAQAAALAPARSVVVDLCCGCGALGGALARAVDVAELHAADVDPNAVECARRNLAAVGGHVYAGDLFDPLPAALRGRIDVLLANVPYVPTSAIALMPPEAREHERRAALDGGPDGLDVLRRVVAEASQWLAPGAHLLVEIGDRQADDAVAAARQVGLAARIARAGDDEALALVARRAG